MEDVVILRSAIPDKEDNLSYNLRDLAAFDLTAFDAKHDDLHKFSRDNVQLLINRIFQLPLSQECKTGPMVVLPAATENAVLLPRAMSLPKPSPRTRWEKFAADRGISKKKRSRMVWDETSKDWVPRWGSNSAKHNEDKATNWVMEVPANSTEDPFEKKSMAQQLVKAKHKLRELRNQVETSGDKVPAGVSHIKEKRGKEAVYESMARANSSTASRGKFDRKVAGTDASAAKPAKKTVVQFKSAKDEAAAAARIMEKVLKAPQGVSRATEVKKAIKKAAPAPKKKK
jgi:regulator of ribosome biosynthesis